MVEDRNSGASQAIGAGSVLAGVGLAGGGIPGTPVPGTKSLIPRLHGGIFGARARSHGDFTQGLIDQAAKDTRRTSRTKHYLRANSAGKIKAEAQIVRHLKRGRIGSNVALGAGGALIAGGLAAHRKSNEVTKADQPRPGDAAMAAGTTLAGTAALGSAAMAGQGKKWAGRAERNHMEAKRLNRRFGGYTSTPSKAGIPHVKATRGVRETVESGDLRRVSRKKSAKLAALGADAKQAAYFADVYGNFAKPLGRVGVGAGAALLAGGALANRSGRRKS